MQSVQNIQYLEGKEMEKQLDITRARQQLASLIDQVKYQKDRYIISRRGQPAAALVPLEVYELWRREREQLFTTIRNLQEENPDADPDQVMQDVLEAQKAVRSSSPS